MTTVDLIWKVRAQKAEGTLHKLGAYLQDQVDEWRKQSQLPQKPKSLQGIYINQEVIYSDVLAKFKELTKG